MRSALAILLALGAHAALAEQPRPVDTRNHRAISLAFLRLPALGAPLAIGERAFEGGISLANDFRRFGLLDEDSEIARLDLRYRQNWGVGREFYVELPLMSRDGGFLDSIIDWWHRNILQWTDPVRDATDHNRSVVELAGEYRFGSAAGIGDLTVGVRQALCPRLTASVAIKLPTGDASRLMGSGAPDFGIALEGWTLISRRWTLYGQIGLVAQGRATRLSGTRGLVDQELLGLLFQANSRETWIVQWQSEMSPTVTGISGADATHRLITFAYRRRLSDTQTLELYFSEDRDLFNGRFPEGANVGPDFTCGVRFGVRF